MCLGRKGPVLPDDYRSHGQDHEDPGKRGTGSRGGFHSLEQAPDAVGQGVSLKLMAFFRFHAAWLLSWNCPQQRADLPMGVPVWLSLTGFDLRDDRRLRSSGQCEWRGKPVANLHSTGYRRLLAVHLKSNSRREPLMTRKGIISPDARPAGQRLAPLPGARFALILLLVINLFNYIDRQVLASVVPSIEKEFFPETDESGAKTDPSKREFVEAKLGSLQTAFMVTYMVIAPIFGWFADRVS